ncbi:MAG: hypothetical protein K2W96_10525, partial [Gemmataceae bacterium]|nr:hypothetical protein [Gemmataceae bacterium]
PSPPQSRGRGGQESTMIRAALWLLLAFVVLGSLGWISNAHGFFEVLRLLAVLCLAAGMLLLIIDYARSPEAPDEQKP